MAKPICTIDGCDRPNNARGLCITHYSRWRLKGTADPQRPVAVKIKRDECVAEGCDRADFAGWGLCIKHYSRWRYRGSTEDLPPRSGEADPKWVGDDATYRTLHQRLQVAFGKAAEHKCVDCGGQGAHWSYDHSDPNEKLSGTGSAYSTDLSRYQPRCSPCHIRFDDIPARSAATQKAKRRAS